ncbi:MAG: CRISPR-associated helicase Cas3' [candidate division WOR-3 bacterium]|nr:CRISPR-associated helicase Cas3' [candidate division WOR-3 bacterium]
MPSPRKPEISDFYKKYLKIADAYPHQRKLWELIRNNKFPLLVRAPTGSGKTEGVIAPFLAQFIENRFNIAPRLIYVLPTRVLVNSIAQRLRAYIKELGLSISVKVQHGDISNAPFFIADVVVTTLDQFLYGFARSSRQVGHHLDIPAGSIASSLVVFDEAHMYRDEFTFSIMRALLEILYTSNVPFVVMTATMPVSLERSLFQHIGLKEDKKIDLSKKEIRSTGGNLKITLKDEPLYSKNSLNIPDDILERIKTQKTLIVVNQVKRAQEIYEELKSTLGYRNEQIALLHSRFTKEDREQREMQALSLIPHKENGEVKMQAGSGVVVSTQVLEAGVDFSAQLLLTELAPADSLVQRAGRCARYNGEDGEMIIFPVEDEGHLPYEKKHLDEAKKWLRCNPDFDLRNFGQVCSFVNETLDYQADDYEASDTLIDLYECVLYADTEPANIQLRESKPVNLVVLDIPSGRRREERLREMLNSIEITAKTITVDIKIFSALNNNVEGIWEYDYQKQALVPMQGGRAQAVPFRTYIIDSRYYDRDIGIKPDNASFII